MKLSVLIANIYNDRDGRGEFYEVGEVFDTKDGYGKLLINEGYCTLASNKPAAKSVTIKDPGLYREELPVTVGGVETDVDLVQIGKMHNFATLLEISGVDEILLGSLVDAGYTTLDDLVSTPANDIKSKLVGVGLTTIRAMQKKAKNILAEQYNEA